MRNPGMDPRLAAYFFTINSRKLGEKKRTSKHHFQLSMIH